MKFSILMANYNAGKYIKAAIKSVFNQTYKDWELVVVDDKSTDDSVKTIRGLLDDSRIKLIIREENGGYGKTLQTAIEHITGEICGILDSDDVLRDDALEIMVKNHLEHPECGLIYSQFMKCDSDLKKIKRGDCTVIPPGITWLDAMLSRRRPKLRVSHFKTFRKSDYDRTDGFHDLRRTVDKDIVLKLEEVTKLLFVDEVLYYYRVHSQCISRSNSTHPFGKEVINKAIERRKSK